MRDFKNYLQSQKGGAKLYHQEEYHKRFPFHTCPNQQQSTHTPKTTAIKGTTMYKSLVNVVISITTLVLLPS